MFIYKIGNAVTITIMGPTLSFVFPKAIFRSTPLESLSNADKQILSNLEKTSGLEIVQEYSPQHQWCHPPEDTIMFNKIYRPSFLGILPLRSQGELLDDSKLATHYHYITRPGNNPVRAILCFLDGIATLTEKGNFLYLSKKDFADLKFYYQKYLQTYTPKRLSEDITYSALSCIEAKISSIDLLNVLEKLRREADELDSHQNPINHIRTISATLDAMNLDNQQLSRTTEKANMLLKAAEKNLDFFETPIDRLTESQFNAKPDSLPKRRGGFIVTNQYLFFAFLLLVEGLNFVANDRRYAMADVTYFIVSRLLISSMFALLTPFADQEFRHTFPCRMFKKAIEGRFGIDEGQDYAGIQCIFL